MKQPLQAIIFPANIDVWEAILNGNKAVTIREGERNYEVGKPVILCSFEEAPLCVIADVQYVNHHKIKGVSPKDFRDDGYTSRKQMLEDLEKFYPDLTLESPITIVRWNNVRGKLKDYWFKGGDISSFISDFKKS